MADRTLVGTAASESPVAARIDFWDVLEEVASYLGVTSSLYGESFPMLRRIITRGYRQFLWPPPTRAAGGKQHQWSFLHPLGTLNMTSGKAVYQLPGSFVSLSGPFTLDDAKRTEPARVILQSEAKVRRMRSKFDDETGRPKIVAVRPGEPSESMGQPWDAVFYPTPDEDYTLHYRYTADVDDPCEAISSGTGTLADAADALKMEFTASSDSFGEVEAGDKLYLKGASSGPNGGAYPIDSVDSNTEVTILAQDSTGDSQFEALPGSDPLLGGITNSEVVIESCLAVAEMREDDTANLHHEKFQQLLESSVDRDRRMGAPRKLGYNGDSSISGYSSNTAGEVTVYMDGEEIE